MGCVVTTEAAKPDPKAGAKNGAKPGAKDAGKDSSKNYDKDKPGAKKGAENTPSKLTPESDPDYLKQLDDLPSQFTTFNGNPKKYYITANRKEKSLEFSALSSLEEAYSIVYTEQDMNGKRGDKLTWGVMFKSLKIAFLGAKITVKEGSTSVTLTVPMEGSSGKASITLTLKAITGNVGAMHRLFLEPLCAWFAKRKGTRDEDSYLQFEMTVNQKKHAFGDFQSRMTQLQAELEPLQKNARQAADDAGAMREQCDGIHKRIEQLKNPGRTLELYPDAPAKFHLHLQWAREHVPRPLQPNGNAMQMIKAKFGGDNSIQVKADNINSDAVMAALELVDDWGFDVFKVQEATQGGSLFMTTYYLLHKYGLVRHFNINEECLVNFLTAIESGYHPNPYHNSTHAADVLQITHYIISHGGMSETIKMTQEDFLAALLAAAIHDYDHPGFNNNFHCKTNAYLATLYNDRSVLENHHLAQVFELMKNPKYNLFGSLTEDQKKDVRDTMIEMVLSTDMGNHAKIFQTFRKRLSDEQEWTKKEDQRLALSIAIKMADISNCCRPNELYLKWAKLIADEFYLQGDVEAKLKLPISPFMDRKKDKLEFPRGQVSFMNYIVIPLFESGAQFLPKLDFTVENIHRNRDYWQNSKTEE